MESALKAAGLPIRVAEEVAERVEDRVQDRWTTKQVNEQVDLELRRLEEDIQRAEATYKRDSVKQEISHPEEPRIETDKPDVFIPASEKERHERRF